MERTYIARFTALIGRSRTTGGAMECVIEWLEKQDRDTLAAIFDGLSPESEIFILERAIARARRDLSPSQPTPPATGSRIAGSGHVHNYNADLTSRGTGTRKTGRGPDAR